MPIDKDATDLLTPLFDMTKFAQGDNYNYNNNNNNMTHQQKRMMNSGISSNTGTYAGTNTGAGRSANVTKRSVSETKKKFVAAEQGWKCGACKEQLPAWFEVDHKIRLDNGGSNHVDNLVALCRDCHGKKTAFENL
jgi:hypothetical protein